MIAERAGFDFDRHYRAAGYRGVAWYVIGYDTEWTQEEWTYLGDEEDPDAGADDYFERTGYYYPDENPANYLYSEPEEVANRDRVRAVMVGDDRVFTFDVEDLEPIAEEDFCHECGQIGCTRTHSVVMTIQHGLKIITFALLGFAFGPYIALLIGLVACSFLAATPASSCSIACRSGFFAWL